MRTTCDPSDATLAVLAGGEGARMGRPKGLLRIGDKPILEYLHQRLAWPGPTCLVTAPGKENPPGASLFDREWVDPQAGLGPLRGVLTALENLHTPLLTVITVDMPVLRQPYLRYLLDALLASPQTLGAMFERLVDDEPQPEPFPLALRPEAIEPVRSALVAAKRSVKGLLRDPSFHTLPTPPSWPQSVWTNLNEPGDVDSLIADC
ncbi:MAG TPA: molybdenum cofactor guanylyltransferase [Tepidisphaeraceae bacterium]|jgi:molybdopterin-guanine dinucleotide biosynthesis protein A|nr:molybdenum cofactor guanylyltransferase [Tepidisphaeraceae bacterium]